MILLLCYVTLTHQEISNSLGEGAMNTCASLIWQTFDGDNDIGTASRGLRLHVAQVRVYRFG